MTFAKAVLILDAWKTLFSPSSSSMLSSGMLENCIQKAGKSRGNGFTCWASFEQAAISSWSFSSSLATAFHFVPLQHCGCVPSALPTTFQAAMVTFSHVSITTMFVNRLFVAMDTARPAEPRAVWASQKLELSYSFEPLSEGALSGGIDFK